MVSRVKKREGYMKILYVLLLIAVFTGSVIGGNIDYLTNRSVNYIRNFARNVATEGADLVSYNPAGLVFMDEGFHISFGNEIFLKDYTIDAVPFWDTTSVETYQSTEPTLLYPDFYAVLRTGDWAVFGAFTIPAGGGSLDYKDGVYAMPLIETGLQQMMHPGTICFAIMDSGAVKVSSRYMAGTVGASFAVNDAISFSLAGRYTTAKRTYDGFGDFTVTWIDTTAHQSQVSRTLDVEKTANGFSGTVSVNAVPVENLNIALKYETRTNLDFETNVIENSWAAFGLPDSSFTDGYKQRRDLPAVLSGGISYRFSPEFLLSTTFNYYMVEDADEGEFDGLDDDYTNGLDIGIGIDYQFTPKLLGGLAYLRSDLGGSEDTFSDFEYNLDCHCIGGGLRYSVTEAMAVTVAGGRNIYDEGQGSGIYEDCTYNKSVWYFGLGAEFSFK